jgi:hypothetical protein
MSNSEIEDIERLTKMTLTTEQKQLLVNIDGHRQAL